MTRIIETPPPSKPPSTSSSSETRRAPVTAVPPPSNCKTPPIPSDSHTNSKQESDWKAALESLERRIIAYQNLAKEGKATEEDAGGVSDAFRNVADSHTDPKVKAHFEQKAKDFEGASPSEREEILKGILKGFLVLLATPFLAVGAALLTAGMILRGVGLGLKVAGQFALKNLNFWGSSGSSTASGGGTSKSE